ncbi:MAG: tripartite tricarboxylate transporter substrate binding protein [Deltaproteobacteria bacterium]|nr:MAG: tripartite tricarboxylate transporter substrate binding protein [Deltaproteobacteria bacterium]
MLRKSLTPVLGIILIGSLLVQPAMGKEYPTRAIEILCPYAPGSSMDIVSRIVADIAPKYLGQSLVVVNKVGAGGSVSAADLISSKPDGYKLAWLANFFFATTVKTQRVPFDPNDIVPIINLHEYKLGLIVKGDSPWKTLNDLLDYAKKNPGKVKMAHGARGHSLHLGTLVISKKAGVDFVEIVYKGASPEQLAALLGGHVDVSSMAYGAVKDHVKAGNVRYLVFFSDRRYSDPPGVPCALELGFPEAANLVTLTGVYAHKNTPEGIKKTLFDGFKKVYEDPEFQQRIERMGDSPRFGGPEFMKEAIRKAEEVGVPIIKELGLYVGK